MFQNEALPTVQTETKMANLPQNDEEDNFPNDLRCIVCSMIFLRPIELIPCCHIFCETCINRWQQSRRTTCPLCRSEFEYYIPINDVIRYVLIHGAYRLVIGLTSSTQISQNYTTVLWILGDSGQSNDQPMSMLSPEFIVWDI